ncbi:MAG: hypothetical protein AAGA54_11600 [Myxococcota bacterium]
MSHHRSHDSSHGKTVVASSPIATVEACSCGVVHVHLGAVSMRFTEQSLEALQRTLTEALVRMNSAPETAPAPSAPLFMAGGRPRGQA